MRKQTTAALLFVLAGCGGGAVREPVAPSAPAPSATTPAVAPSASSTSFAVPETPRDPATSPPEPGAVRLDAWSKASKVKGVAPAPSTCAAFAKRTPATPATPDLASALAEADVNKRDALLASLEKGEPVPGLVRAIRAELAPIECGDVLVDPLLTGKSEMSGQAGHALVGLSLAAKLARTASNPPALRDAVDKEKLKTFIKGPLRAWVVEQASAVEALSAPAGGLAGHGRGVVAIEAGVADLRLVDQIRSSPVPKGWDAELKGVYEAALDEALEPRKARGRDAALVGLSDLAAEGVLSDKRVDRARALLSKLYGGRRIDALDGLLLPTWDPPKSGASDVPVAILSSALFKPNAALQHHARARLDLGRRYWRRVDFVEAAHAAKAAGDKDADARLILAVALTLAKGPNGPREMMLAPSPAALHLGETGALDALVAEGGRNAGMAAFDAAHLRALSPPEGDALAPYLDDVAARFKKAASLLEDPAQKKRAEDRAAEAEAVAKAAASAGTKKP